MAVNKNTARADTMCRPSCSRDEGGAVVMVTYPSEDFADGRIRRGPKARCVFYDLTPYCFLSTSRSVNIEVRFIFPN